MTIAGVSCEALAAIIRAGFHGGGNVKCGKAVLADALR